MQKALFKILLLVFVLGLVYVTSWYFGAIFSFLEFERLTSIESAVQLAGVGLAYVFWIAMLGGFLRTRVDFCLMVAFLLPALWWEMQLDASRIYFPIALGIIGFVIGHYLRLGIEKLLKRPLRI